MKILNIMDDVNGGSINLQADPAFFLLLLFYVIKNCVTQSSGC